MKEFNSFIVAEQKVEPGDSCTIGKQKKELDGSCTIVEQEKKELYSSSGFRLRGVN